MRTWAQGGELPCDERPNQGSSSWSSVKVVTESSFAMPLWAQTLPPRPAKAKAAASGGPKVFWGGGLQRGVPTELRSSGVAVPCEPASAEHVDRSGHSSPTTTRALFSHIKSQGVPQQGEP